MSDEPMTRERLVERLALGDYVDADEFTRDLDALLAQARAEILAALERATDCWSEVPGYGRPWCRFCGLHSTDLRGGDHAPDCPVSVLARAKDPAP
jgi:hypothetical protein